MYQSARLEVQTFDVVDVITTSDPVSPPPPPPPASAEPGDNGED